MRKKRIDQILTSAFEGGDLGHTSEAERAELELARTMRKGLASLGKDLPECQLSNERLKQAVVASLSPAQRVEFEAGRVVTKGLEALKDVPQHQLSNERLRDAILGEAAVPRRTFAGWNYAFGAMACLVAAILLVKGFGTPDQPRTNDVQPIVANGNSEETGLEDSTTFVQPPTRDTSEPVGIDRPAPRQRSYVVAAASVGPNYHDMSDSAKMHDFVRELDFSADTDIVVEPAALNTEPRGPIVVVDSATTTDKGAARATEMSSYGDVVFGG